MDNEINGRKFREIYTDVDGEMVKWTEPSQTEEAEFLKATPVGDKNSLLYWFRRADGSIFKSWEKFGFKKKLAQVQPGAFVRIVYVGFDEKRHMKQFKVFVAEGESF